VSARLLVLLLAILGCNRDAKSSANVSAEGVSAFAAASRVVRADSNPAARAPHTVPLHEMTGDVEILFGDPDKAGEPFVMRIRELPGSVVPLHSHPVDEHITVVQGTWFFAVGDTWDQAALKELKTGAYAFAPKGRMMFAASPDGAVVQVHGIGPFHIHWRDGVKTLDDDDAAATFKLRRGQHVQAPRGAGTIREGYASGAIIQYEIEGDGGEIFMAHQKDVRPTNRR
jgi:quercetin dioxygenase-like cupin family protein